MQIKSKVILNVLVIIFVVIPFRLEAKDQQQINVNDVIIKMQKDLNLTDEQGKAIKPIIEQNIARCQAYFESVVGEVVIKKSDIKLIMKKFRQEENEELSKILSEDQMKKLIERQNLKDALNRDTVNFAESLEQSTVMIGQGASLQF